MKKTLFFSAFLIAFVWVSRAQVYTGAVGLGIGLYEGATAVGPSGKYFFAENHAGQADLLFADGVTIIGAVYQYHGQFSGAEGLQWFAGAGPDLFLFGNGLGSNFNIRFTGGLEYKIPDVPLVFAFDWRPTLSLESNVTERFDAGIFGLGFRYAFD